MAVSANQSYPFTGIEFKADIVKKEIFPETFGQIFNADHRYSFLNTCSSVLIMHPPYPAYLFLMARTKGVRFGENILVSTGSMSYF